MSGIENISVSAIGYPKSVELKYADITEEFIKNAVEGLNKSDPLYGLKMVFYSRLAEELRSFVNSNDFSFELSINAKPKSN